MLKAAKIIAAATAVWVTIIFSEVLALAASEGIPSCGGFGGGGGGGGASAGGEGGDGMMSLMFPLVIFVAIFYFFIIRPQKRQKKQQDTLISGIGKGDQVITIGGFFGVVQEVRNDCFIIEISKDIRVKILKSAVSTKQMPGQMPTYTENK